MRGLSSRQAVIKRSFDVFVSTLGIVLAGWLIIVAWCLSTFDTKSNGFFMQSRVGLKGKQFKVIKIKTMRPVESVVTTVTTVTDPRITSLGKIFRKTKIDELPQLINVLLGHMSFVGPRPDVPGFADKLKGEDRIILTVRPGITGPATLKYKNEEQILSFQKDPEVYNENVIFPDKVAINREYVQNYSFIADLHYLLKTLFN